MHQVEPEWHQKLVLARKGEIDTVTRKALAGVWPARAARNGVSIVSKVLYVHPQQAAEWEERAECRQADLTDFYPEHGNRSPARAKRVCRRCPVRDECLETALRNDERFGIWGGMTEKERRDLPRRRAQT